MTAISDISAQVQQAKARWGIIGNAPALIAAIQRALKVAPIDLSVLVTGESGSGKEFFPQIIHAGSPRKHAKYIAVNCGAIPEGTIDSELFGHEKGAFTGAVSSRKGYFEEADGGTIFLDEVAELPLTTQARLLRVLESGEFIKVGSSTVQKTNIRIVAATNVDMARAVEEGRFREDLYYRLSTIRIEVPPLRDRGSDVTLLARKFAIDFAERYRTPAVTFSEDASRMLMRYPWPGNVRQLKNVIEQIALFDAGATISGDGIAEYLPAHGVTAPATIDRTASADSGMHSYATERELLFNMIFSMRGEIDELRAAINDLRTGIRHHSTFPEAPTLARVNTPQSLVRYTPAHDLFSHSETIEEAPRVSAETIAGSSPRTLEDTERETIRIALEHNEGRRKATARELNISERTLYRKIKDYGLE
ncbi:sigma-54-dependent Fis family transcriptional regulator [Muribaculum sp.]|uniref:sigma-54 interaction domain-containing protein n=1 Tax=Muribaculum sp. TaxID=1918611 RepID=UPI0023D20F14|nr:sigma-54 dependent transcriptional regulator [Muribaculum sp.]MDE5704625.1 sigma-54 dependent transcriptional regulator [Muribaculum sp.]